MRIHDCGERDGQARDDQRGRFDPRNGNGLFVQGDLDALDQPLGHPQRLRPQQGDQAQSADLAYQGRNPNGSSNVRTAEC